MAADQGHPGAQFVLGWMYWDGDGVPRDPAQAVSWLRKAAEQGHADAQAFLGAAYHDGNGVQEDPTEALRWSRKAAEQGHARAQMCLGAAYEHGHGVRIDPAEAVRWYCKAAAQGLADAQCALGNAYYIGKGVVKNPVEGVRWYRKAVEQGHADAQHKLGLAYHVGEGVAQDYEESLRLWRKAAEQGHAGAQFGIAVAYHAGAGVAQDPVEAVRWYRMAADQGHVIAQGNLAHAYEVGDGVPRDPAEALLWWSKAAKRGHAGAQHKLGLAHQTGAGVTKDPIEAMRWHRMAADQGLPEAQQALGDAYANGEGVAPDAETAANWYSRAGLGWATRGQGEKASSCLERIRELQAAASVRLADELAAAISAQAPLKIGRYRVVRLLGSGATGRLYVGHDDRLNRDVIIKVLDADKASDPGILSRFEREVQITASLDHPNIIRVLDQGHDRGAAYVAFEALEGQTLGQALEAGISIGASIPILIQVLDGLAHAHAAGVVHCDIRPDNVFIQRSGAAKIVDFEGAQRTAEADAREIGATADYMSPEQARGEKLDVRSDLFAVGCVLFEVTTGHRPFHADNLMAILYGITHEDPNFDVMPNDPHWKRLRDVMTKALQKKPEDRYPDASAMRRELEVALKELGESAARTPAAAVPSGSRTR
jgi:TPR repeat protein